MKQSWVYFMASRSGVLYIGVTSDLDRRMQQHKAKEVRGFTRQYNTTMLVYAVEFAHITDAIAREKQLKNWSRAKKIELIERVNPEWLDLSHDVVDQGGLWKRSLRDR